MSTFLAHYASQHWFQLPNHSLISQAPLFTDEACETNYLLERCWEKDPEDLENLEEIRLQPSCWFQLVTCECALCTREPAILVMLSTS